MLTEELRGKSSHIYINFYYLGLEINQREGLRIIKLNRPKKLNAFNKELIILIRDKNKQRF